MIRDIITDKVNEHNTAMWKEQAGNKHCRLTLAIGVIPGGELELYMAREIPPEIIVQMLRKAAEAIEAANTSRIIIKP